MWFSAACAVFLVALSFSMHLPKVLVLSLAAAVPAFVALLLIGRDRAVALCMVCAAFLSGAPIKVGQLNLSDVFLLAMLAVLVLERDTTAPVSEIRRGVLVGLGLMAVGGLIGGFFEPAVSPFRIAVPLPEKLLFFPPKIGDLLRFAYGTAGIVLLVRAARLNRRRINYALAAYCLGAVLSVAWSFVSPSSGHTGRALGLAAHPVQFGWICAVAVLVAVGLWLSQEPMARRVAVVTVFAGVVGIGLSGTRSAVLIVVAGIAVLQFGLRSARRTTMFAVLALMAFGIALSGVAGDTPVVSRLGSDPTAQQSNEGRDVLREDTVRIVRHHGFTGIGFKYLFPPHNMILGVLGAAGILGLIGFLVLAASLMRRLLALPPADTPALAALSAALAAYVCSWVVNVAWDHWFWVPVALALAVGTSPADEPDGPRGDAAPARAPLP